MTQLDAQDVRVADILGDMLGNTEFTFEDCVAVFCRHLANTLQLPCDVTGIEDFRWEEFYVVGPGDKKEHEKLRRNQPSYEDIFELLAVEKEAYSEWMMFGSEDLAALTSEENQMERSSISALLKSRLSIKNQKTTN